jgi:choline dehydrogenase-like flavoprotein
MSVPGAWPTLLGSEVDWRYTTVPQPGPGGAAIPYPRGRVLGGSIAINAMFHQRGDRSAIEIAERAAAIITGHDRVVEQANAVYTLVP